jgi:hypothetical protein
MILSQSLMIESAYIGIKQLHSITTRITKDIKTMGVVVVY